MVDKAFCMSEWMVILADALRSGNANLYPEYMSVSVRIMEASHCFQPATRWLAILVNTSILGTQYRTLLLSE